MTTSTHPEDLELFEYVEGDLDDVRYAQIEAHVSSCDRCAEEIRVLEAGKTALREAPLLELPERRRAALVKGLPRQTERKPLFTPKRLVAILTPVAAAIAAVAVLVNTDGGNGDERAAVPAAAEQAEQAGEPVPASEAEPPADAAGEVRAAEPEVKPAEAEAEADFAAPEPESAAGGEAVEAGPPAEEVAPPAEEAAEPEAAAAPALPVASVAGPPETVVEFLQAAGFNARVIDGAVEVIEVDPEALEQALEDLPPGDVPVFIP